MRILSMFALLAGACAGDAPPPGTPACTQALYDSCSTEHDCMSMNCHNFPDVGFQVCSQGCSAADPCPMQGAVAVECNAMSICQPATENVCVIQP